MPQIELAPGVFCLFDDVDAELVGQIQWRLMRCPSGHRYAQGKFAGRATLMHREILGAKKGEYIDHLNGDGLDNRRGNIRKCSQSQNIAWSDPSRKTFRSQFRGVTIDKRSGRWAARIKVNGVRRRIGTFPSEDLAAKAYNQAAAAAFGEFARLNIA